MVQTWNFLDIEFLKSFWNSLLHYTFLVLVALVVFVIGWVISCAVGKLTASILKGLRFNRLFETKGWKDALEKADIKVDASEFIGAIFKWILVIVSLDVSVGVLRWTEFTTILKGIIGYLPNVIVAVLIFVVTVVVADIVDKLVRAGIGGIKIGYAKLAGTITKWAIWIFAIFAILIQLKIAKDLLLTLFQGLVALIVIAGGIAFGLGGKDVATELLQDLKEKFKKD